MAHSDVLLTLAYLSSDINFYFFFHLVEDFIAYQGKQYFIEMLKECYWKLIIGINGNIITPLT